MTVNNHTETDNSEATCAPSDIASCSKQKDSEESNSLDGLPEKTEECQADGSKTGKINDRLPALTVQVIWRMLNSTKSSLAIARALVACSLA